MCIYDASKAWILVLLLSFALCVGLTPILIRYGLKHKIDNGIKLYLPTNHQKKFYTPNMGGIVIVISIVISTCLFCSFSGIKYWATLVTLLSFALVGLCDDLSKTYSRTRKGIPEKQKFILQVLAAVVAYSILKYFSFQHSTFCRLPFTSHVLDLGYFYDLFCILVICSASNAVNITDGLDGLAILPVCVSAAAFLYVVMFGEDASFSLSLVCSGIIGSGLAFLIYNRHPAKIFMGDTGSLSLGATLGMISVITKNQFFLAIVGGVFVIETLSVIVQISYRTIRPGKKIFKMAPIHHHFEQIGMSETKIVKGFWIASLLFAALGLSGRLLTIQ